MSCEGLHHAESRKKYDKRKKERETCWRKEPGEKMRWTERERERERVVFMSLFAFFV